MSPSGLVYAVIVALWAAVLIPIWLRRHDEAAMTRSADRYSRAMRTLSRRPARIDSREMVMPRRTSAAPHVDAARPAPRRDVSVSSPAGSPRTRTGPASARAASAQLARRRARSLLVLAVVTLALVALAAFGVVPWWAAVPAALLFVGFVVHLRLQARRAALLLRRPPSTASSAPTLARDDAPRASIDLSRAVVVETKGQSLGAATVGARGQEGTTAEDVDQHVPAEGADDAWRPESWPVPTYVTKPKAIRPIRVIDLTTPGAWTSGRLLDDEIETQEQAVAEAHKADDELDAIIEHADPAPSEQRRVVND